MRNKHNRVPDFNYFHTHVGDKEYIERSGRRRSDGTIELVETGRVNIQAEINSHAEETDMALIVQKLMYGDTSVLTHKKPMYGDFTQFPKTYAEMLNLMDKSKDTFNSLSPDIKTKYDNDINKWFASIGTDSWMSDMGFVKPVVPSPSESEVVE